MKDVVHFQPSIERQIPATSQRIVGYYRSRGPESLQRTSLRKGHLAHAHLVIIYTVQGEYRFFVYMAYVEKTGGVLMDSPMAKANPDEFQEREARVLRWLDEMGFSMEGVDLPSLGSGGRQSLLKALPLSRTEDLKPEPGEVPEQKTPPQRDTLSAVLSGLDPNDALERLRDLITLS